MTNALEQAIDAELKAAKVIQCKTCIAVAGLNDSERRTFDSAVKAGVTPSFIARAMQSLGLDVPPPSLRAHLKDGHSV